MISLSTAIHAYETNPKGKPQQYKQTHDKVILLCDNDQPVAKTVNTCLATIKWKVTYYSPYSPGIASFDYHLSHSMSHVLPKQRFHSYEDTKK
ncbi:hypothetical protein NPIL_675141 [Nephila pilipes]|uniref:Uncharacterized protein n=1 Tax=Nephila pilipes TaxID=299642 RepID=A0A8X6UJJ9_NEPPI|nr:hypothetical protein NPIL_675141 [Nephila pilipes]